MADPDQIRDRALGAMIGLAVGDALGTTVEFLPRDSYPPVKDMVGGGPFRLSPGQWTDDTSLALCLAESLLENAELDAYDLMERFLRWVQEGYNSSTGRCFDIGRTTLGAIRRFSITGDPYAGDSSAKAAGNGSIMRLAPVVVRWWREPAMADLIARKQSITTHAAPEAVDSCALLTRLLCGLIRDPKGDVAISDIETSWSDSVRHLAGGSWRGKKRAEIQSTGYVIHTLEAALWSLDSTCSFEEALLLAVNLGHDSDTVGAVTGQLAGARYGASAIPADWHEKLFDGERIADLAGWLFAGSQAHQQS